MGRWLEHGRIAVAAALLSAIGCMAGLPALAADSALNLAQKALTGGKPDLALRALNAALSGNALKGADIAKAFYLRGLAFAKTGNQAAAIADFNNALYLKGLGEADRQAAIAAKTAAYAKAGVPVKTEASAPPATPALPAVAEVAPAPVVPKASKKQFAAVVTPEPAAGGTTRSSEPLPWQPEASSTSAQIASPAPQTDVAVSAPSKVGAQAAAIDTPFNSLLGGLFSIGQAGPAAANPPPAEAAPAAPATTATVTETVPAWKTASLASTAERAPAPALAKRATAAKPGGIYLQVASLRTTDLAQALADKLAVDHAAILAGLQPTVAPTVLGNMGTFYSVQLGPVASKAAGSALCARLRKEGVDCYFATP